MKSKTVTFEHYEVKIYIKKGTPGVCKGSAFVRRRDTTEGIPSLTEFCVGSSQTEVERQLEHTVASTVSSLAAPADWMNSSRIRTTSILNDYMRFFSGPEADSPPSEADFTGRDLATKQSLLELTEEDIVFMLSVPVEDLPWIKSEPEVFDRTMARLAVLDLLEAPTKRIAESHAALRAMFDDTAWPSDAN